MPRDFSKKKTGNSERQVDPMKQELADKVQRVQKLINMRDYESCRSMICGLMSCFPDSPVPHNLMGILLESRQEHVRAMKHFRAAYALDPTYIPARYNMDQYGSLQFRIKCAFSEADVETGRDKHFEIQYDERGIGHLVRKY